MFRTLFLTVIFAALTSAAYAAVVDRQVTLRICSLESGFGNFSNPDGEGIWQQLVRESVKDLNVKLVLTYAPRARCLLKTRKNDIDAVYAAVTRDRMSYLTFPHNKLKSEDTTRTVGTVQFKIYKKKISNLGWDGKNFTNLSGNSIGVQRGLQVEQTLRDNNMKVDGDLVATPEQNLTKLHMGRIVAAVVEEDAGDEFLKTSGFKDIVKFEKSYTQSDVYLAFSHKFYRSNRVLVEKIWDNIKNNRRKFRNFPANLFIYQNSLVAFN